VVEVRLSNGVASCGFEFRRRWLALFAASGSRWHRARSRSRSKRPLHRQRLWRGRSSQSGPKAGSVILVIHAIRVIAGCGPIGGTVGAQARTRMSDARPIPRGATGPPKPIAAIAPGCRPRSSAVTSRRARPIATTAMIMQLGRGGGGSGKAARPAYSHSIVPGGFDVTS
jgi:hypothetical protein